MKQTTIYEALLRPVLPPCPASQACAVELIDKYQHQYGCPKHGLFIKLNGAKQ